MAYQYVAFTPQGDQIQGRIEAESEHEAEELLWKQKYTVISLRAIQESAGRQLFGSRIKTRDLIVFSRQLATLIEAGVSVVRGLELLRDQIPSKVFQKTLDEIIMDVQQGRFFSEAVANHKKAFPTLYARLLEIGERAGNLVMVLRQVATYMEKEEKLVRRIRGASAYPLFVLFMAFGVVFLMLTVALPPLMQLFTSFGAELPLPTRMLIGLTEFASTYTLQIVLVVVIFIGVGVLFVRSKRGKQIFDRLMIKVPLVGKVIVHGAVARLCRSTATLLQAGISLPEILDMSIRAQSNTVIGAALEQVHSELLQGHGLADPLARQPVFPSMLVQMVRVGEETGSLDSNMDTLAVFYEDEVDRTVDALSSAVEPALTIFIGLIVGFVAVAVIYPMYSLMGSIG
jgi:type IV pilus assembly protein PilC